MFSILRDLQPYFHRLFCYCFLAVLAITLCEAVAYGQNVDTTTSTTDGGTPTALQPGSPVGSYPLSGLDNVNLFNGNLNFHLPLLQVGGRGSAQMTINLALNLKSWHISHFHREMPDGNTIDSYKPTQLGWRPYGGYGAGSLGGRNYGIQTSSNLTCRWYSKTLSRLTFSASDGTEYELRDQLTNGQPLTSTCTQGAYRGTVFVTADGSAATFVSDTAIYDNPAINVFGPHGFSVSGYFMFKDGTRYRIDNGDVTWIRDRNGNKITFTYTTSSMTITDQLNRTVTINYNVSDVAPYGLCDQIIYKGFSGAQRILRVSHTDLANALRPNSGYSIRTLGGPTGLFPETNGSSSTTHNPTVTSAVWLPDGVKSYKFYYNSYGELARVETPIGGAYEYDMTPGSGVIGDDQQIYRRVVERRVYANGSSGASFEHKEIFTNTESVGTSNSTVTVEQIDPAGTVLGRSRHYFDGSALNSLFVSTTYPAWNEGKEKQTDLLDTAGNVASAAVLRRTVTTSQQRAPVSWWVSSNGIYGLEPANDPRITEIVTTVEPATANLVTKQTFAYDDSVPFNNRNSVKEYGFGNGTPGGLLRETRITYLTSSTYTDTNVHIRDLPTQVSIYNGAGAEQARSNIEYDNYVVDSYHAGLVSRSNVSGFDSTFSSTYTTRGNPTASTNSVFVAGSVIGSMSGYSQYDILGNVVKTIDPRSTSSNIIASIVEYDDRFGSPDTEARTNSIPSELTGLSSFAFPTKLINALGHTGYTQFDYYLGRPVNSEDANGVIGSVAFNDQLDRATQIRRAAGTTEETQSTFAYDDANRTVTTSSDRDTLGDNVFVNKVLYDQMGRTIQQRQYEGGSNYIVVETQYDALGRAYKTSYPYRSSQSQTAVWTIRAFDALGREISITTPDNAVVSTNYSGNTVTATDQAGKVRKSVIDALGRLTELYEDPNGLNYQTTYLYDVFNNLVKVTQGSQQRFFMYDSLKRLIRARNPEQGTAASLALSDPITGNSAWSIGYQHDASGNLTQKTDARGVVSTYVYDALNRNTTIDYSDTSINPDVKRFYDGATRGVGRFWYFYSGGDFSTGSNVEATAVDSYDRFGKPLVQRQLSKLDGAWGPTYQTTRTYNLAGAVTSQIYPSWNRVDYSYDAAGRTSSFSGTLGDGTTRSYSTSIDYDASGGVRQEQFGTQTPLYHKKHYNMRGQLFDIRLSTVPWATDQWNWNRGALVNYYSSNYAWEGDPSTPAGPDNNGNVLLQQHWVPSDDAISSYNYTQDFYAYDSLNRIQSAVEVHGTPAGQSAQDHAQVFAYDRWGNRTINAAQTSGAGINNKQFTVDSATNRLGVPSGQSGVMTYDDAGNLIADTYTGTGNRTYDANNKMITATDNTGQVSRYTYDADGRRVRRKVASGQEQWQIYGIEGELIAEYPAGAPASAPEKEYGYRGGELLVTATGRFNVALAANGAVATASSAHTCCGFSVTGAINGNYHGPWGNGEGWNDATPDVVPDWIQVDFAGSKTIDEIDVYSLHDNYTQENTPTETQTFTLYGLLAFDVQYWNGSSWVTVPGGSVTGNNKVWRKFTFSPITTNKIRVYINQVPDSWSRVVEIQAFGTSAGGEKVQWLVPDHLGTPRIIVDQTGSLTNVKRHDYLPFGEELFAPAGGRTATQGYVGNDAVRQRFTEKERDVETGLDYFIARYYSSIPGRFTGVDPLTASAKPETPQSWNRYSYCINNPLLFVDPEGLVWGYKHDEQTGITTYQWFDGDEVGEGFTRVTNFYVEGIIDGKQFSLTLNPDGPESAWRRAAKLLDYLGFFMSDDDYYVKGYKIGPTQQQLWDRYRSGGVDMMPNQAFEIGLLLARVPAAPRTAASGVSLEGSAFELKFLDKHLEGTAAAAREISKQGSAHVFNDLSTLSRVESEIFARGVNTGETRGFTRFGFRFDEPIGTRIGADGTRTSLNYGEMKMRDSGLYHIIPRTGPSQ